MRLDIKLLLTIASLGACASFMILMKRKTKNTKLKRAIWARKWLLLRDIAGKGVQNLVFDELAIEDPISFKNFTRMTSSTFNFLLGKIRPKIQREDTQLRQSISARTRLLLSLRYLANGENFTSLSYYFRIAVPTVTNIINETLCAIYEELKPEYLKTPQSKLEWEAVAEQFYHQWNFPNCLGAIDGKHFAFRSKKIDGSLYYNYKGFNSIVLLAVAGANYNFLYVDVGCNGRVNDAGVYSQCSLCKAIADEVLDFPESKVLPGDNSEIKIPYVFIGHEAFKLTTKMIKPHSQRSNKAEKIFHYQLSRARRVVENVSGILANTYF